jgi:hypothetical protein
MEKFEQIKTPTNPSEENLKWIEENETKKQNKRESRLKKIVEKNSELLQILFPEKASDFEFTYKEIKETKSSLFPGEMTTFSVFDLPAYGIFLRKKSEPENTRQIMYWLRPDIDAKKNIFEIALNQKFSGKIKESVEELQ